MRKLHFAASHNYALSASQIELTNFITPVSAEIGVLIGLARMLGCTDVAAIARPSDSPDWIPVYIGDLCLKAGLDVDSLSTASTSYRIDSEFGDARWIIHSCTDPLPSILIMTLQGVNGERFIVGLLFNLNSTSERRAVEAQATNAMSLLTSIMQNCIQMRNYQLRLDGSGAALDRLDAGIVLLNRNCEVIHENVIAKRILDRGIGIRRRGNSVVATDLGAAVRFRVAMEHVLSAEMLESTTQTVPLLALMRGKTQRPLLASIFPAHSQVTLGDAVSAIVFLFDPEREINHLLQSACQLFGLSPVETELACRLAQGETIAEAASALKIKELTARGYLKQIFIKTGVNRQAALVRLLLSSIMHFGDDPELVVM